MNRKFLAPVIMIGLGVVMVIGGLIGAQRAAGIRSSVAAISQMYGGSGYAYGPSSEPYYITSMLGLVLLIGGGIFLAVQATKR